MTEVHLLTSIDHLWAYHTPHPYSYWGGHIIEWSPRFPHLSFERFGKTVYDRSGECGVMEKLYPATPQAMVDIKYFFPHLTIDEFKLVHDCFDRRIDPWKVLFPVRPRYKSKLPAMLHVAKTLSSYATKTT